jgi:hypothetical protein
MRSEANVRNFFTVITVLLLIAPILGFLWLVLAPLDPRIKADMEGAHIPVDSLVKLTLAMHEYHEKHGRLPPAVVTSKEGVPLLSWRVLLLPHMGEGALFQQFKLDEPWDSPHNIRLLDHMPRVFCPMECGLPPHTTPFQVFVGEGTAFEGREGLPFRPDFTGRMSDTILIAESANPIPWTKPEDIRYDPGQPLPKLGGAFFKNRLHLALLDAGVRTFRKNLDEATLRAAILRTGPGPGKDW